MKEKKTIAEITRFLCGAKYFFGDKTKLEFKDTDYIVITEHDYTFLNRDYFRMFGGKHEDLFCYTPQTKEWHINQTIEDQKEYGPLWVCRFIIPEFCNYIGFEVSDLPKLDEVFNKLGKKHEYAKMIYHYYVENGEFKLTDEQLNEAFKSYCTSRKIDYNLYL